METIGFRSQKISYHSLDELCVRLNELAARRIISIQPCLSDYTNLSQWVEVYYEY